MGVSNDEKVINVAWLEENVLKCKLSDNEKQQLAGCVDRVEFAKGETIVKEGDSGGFLYLLRRGSADVLKETAGHQQRITTAGEGALFGEVTFLTGEPASASVVANQDCVVYKMSRAGYSKLMQTSQELVFALFTYMLVSTSKIVRKMNEEHAGMLDYMTGSHK
jgi:CRP-like cAMP-binding protein